MTDEEKAEYDLQELEELTELSADERAVRLRQAQLLAGVLWHASVVMVDQLFDDLQTVSELDEITLGDVDDTWVLASLPSRFAHCYGIGFTRKFLVIAAELTGTLARGWRQPDCVAGDLAVKCLLDQAETAAELFNLDLADNWRSDLEDQMVEDFDYDMLYDRSLDGFEDDSEFTDRFRIVPMRFEYWFKPFHEAYSVPPYVMD